MSPPVAVTVLCAAAAAAVRAMDNVRLKTTRMKNASLLTLNRRTLDGSAEFSDPTVSQKAAPSAPASISPPLLLRSASSDGRRGATAIHSWSAPGHEDPVDPDLLPPALDRVDGVCEAHRRGTGGARA